MLNIDKAQTKARTDKHGHSLRTAFIDCRLVSQPQFHAKKNDKRQPRILAQQRFLLQQNQETSFFMLSGLFVSMFPTTSLLNLGLLRVEDSMVLRSEINWCAIGIGRWDVGERGEAVGVQ